MMEAKNVTDQEKKLNATNLEGIHYEYKYNPEFKRYDIEFELYDNCDQRILDFIENLYQKSKGLNFQLDAIQDNKQKQLIELLLNNKPASNTNRPISAEIKIHEAKFSIKIISKKRMLTDAQKIELIRYWKVPTLPNHFIGRQQLLEELAQRLDLTKVETPAVVLTACHGLGGIGKTFLAAQYAQTQRENYTFTLWFNAESDEMLYREYYDFAAAIQLSIEKQSPENIIAMVKHWLETHSAWLIIYDNAPDDKLIAKFRPTKGGKILITSRKESWNKKDSLSINVFSLKEARAYIIELTGFSFDEHRDKIDKLAETLGYLPLALAQACAYIAVNHLSLEEYLALYAESRAKMLEDNTMPAETNHERVAITWNITFKAIEKQNAEASALLESCAFLDGSHIPEFLLKELFAKQQPELAKQAKPFIDAMRCLQQYSMLKLINQEKEKAFNMHNLVQEVIVDALSRYKKQTYFLEIIELLKSIFPYQAVEQVEDMIKQHNLLPHLGKMLKYVKEWLDDLKNDKEYKKLAKLCEFLPSIETIEKKLYVPLLVICGHGYRQIGDTRQERELLEKVLLIQEKHYGKDHFEISSSLVSLANALLALGDMRQAKEFIMRALRIEEQHYDETHPELAITLTTAGNIVRALGEFKESRNFLERALRIKKQYFSNEHPEVAITLSNLGDVLQLLGDAKQSKTYLQQALSIFEKCYGTDHPKFTSALLSLGNAKRDLGEFEESKNLFERALHIQKQYYGEEYIEVAKTLRCLNYIEKQVNNNNKQQSKVILQHALQIQEQHYDSDHIEIASTLVDLADTMTGLGDIRQAINLLERVVPILHKHYDFNHPQVAITLNTFANTFSFLEDIRQSKIFRRYAISIIEKYYGLNHPTLVSYLRRLARDYYLLDKSEKTKKCLERAYKILLNHPDFGQQHPQTLDVEKALDMQKEFPSIHVFKKNTSLTQHGIFASKAHVNHGNSKIAFTQQGSQFDDTAALAVSLDNELGSSEEEYFSANESFHSNYETAESSFSEEDEEALNPPKLSIL